MAEKKANVIKNASKGYGYNYSSLSDIANAGYEIPLMRTKTTEFGEWMEWRGDKGEWQQGAKIVPVEMKGMNAAQAYGSSMTYARRYTALMANRLVCSDDDALERQQPEPPRSRPWEKAQSKNRVDFDQFRQEIDEINDKDTLRTKYAEVQAASYSEGQKKILLSIIEERSKKL